ncbi:hypothetical protein AAYQ05_07850 [Flavobacterium sp. B11]|uniref:hypothetical protein n=1 Tax=Flavobacterium movens TaxID=214860 RepID=UPI0031E13239
MKKTIVMTALLVLFISCASTNSTTVAVGEAKTKVLKKLGNPIRTLDNNQNGEILVYADQVFNNENSDGSKIAGPNYWRYNYVYISKEGKVTSTHQEKQNYPPQAIDSRKMQGMNLLTSK